MRQLDWINTDSYPATEKVMLLNSENYWIASLKKKSIFAHTEMIYMTSKTGLLYFNMAEYH